MSDGGSPARFFGFYIGRIANYSATYAGLAGIVILMFFLYIQALIFLYGAELNRSIADFRGDPLCHKEGAAVLIRRPAGRRQLEALEKKPGATVQPTSVHAPQAFRRLPGMRRDDRLRPLAVGEIRAERDRRDAPSPAPRSASASGAPA